MKGGQRGFTLVELLVTTGVIALIGTTAALSLPGALDSYQLRKATAAVVQGLREAQVQAIQSNRYWRVLLVEGAGQNRYYIQKSVSGSPSEACDLGASGWETVRPSEPFANSVQMEKMTHQCITYKPTGVTHWGNPQVVLQQTDYPRYDEPVLRRLTDGYEVSDRELTSAFYPGTSGSPAAFWRKQIPVAHIVVDLQEERYVPTFCVGLIRVSPSYPFPTAMKVFKAQAGAPNDWTEVLRFDDGGNQDPTDDEVRWTLPGVLAGNRQRSCVEVTLQSNLNPTLGNLRYLKIELTADQAPNAAGTLVDEVNLHPQVTLRGGNGKGNIIRVSPNTGIVTVRPAK